MLDNGVSVTVSFEHFSSLVFLEGFAIVAVLQGVGFHPLAVIVSTLGCDTLNYGNLAQVNLEPFSCSVSSCSP